MTGPQEPRRDAKKRWLCQAPGCNEVGVLGWRRAHKNPGDETEVTGCRTHALDLEEASLLHTVDCQAPPTCTCSASGGSSVWPGGSV